MALISPSWPVCSILTTKTRNAGGKAGALRESWEGITWALWVSSVPSWQRRGVCRPQFWGSPASWGVREGGQTSVWGISGEHQCGGEKKMTDGMVAGKRERREERGMRGRERKREGSACSEF